MYLKKQMYPVSIYNKTIKVYYTKNNCKLYLNQKWIQSQCITIRSSVIFHVRSEEEEKWDGILNITKTF